MNRITIEEFKALPVQEQEEIIKDAGELFETAYEKTTKRELYSIDRFFVEVQLNVITLTPILIKAFDADDLIDYYFTEYKNILTQLHL